MLLSLFFIFLSITQAYCSSSIVVEESATGAILSFPDIPFSDSDLYNITWEVEPAAFGFADYGGTLEAYLVLPANKTYHEECDSGEPSDVNEFVTFLQSYQGFDALWILVIDRGDCYFATKVYNAERLGAAGVIMLDNKQEGFLIMWEPDDFEHDVTIPSVLLKKGYSEILMSHLGVNDWNAKHIDNMTYPSPMEIGNDTFVVTKAVIEWGLPHEDDRVEWEVWTSANDDRTMEFKRNFKSAALALDYANDTVFTPHYYILNGSHWNCDNGKFHCGNQCTNQGRYCAVDPEKDLSEGIAGMDVVQEDLRQLCIWNFTTHNENSIHNESLWWDYSVLWNDNCFNDTNNELTFNANCSYRQMTTLDSDGTLGLIDYVLNCIETSGGYGYNDSENSILDYEVRFRESESVHVLPTFRVNEFMIYGEVDCKIVTEDGCAVLDSICSGFIDGTQPDICYATPAPTMANCSMNERDCMGLCWGTSENDRCNVCQDPSSREWNSCVGCDNVTDSGYSTNHCGYCMDSSASNFSTYGEDCQHNGTCDDGSYATDACGECLWLGDEDWNACKGCDGVINSNATWRCGLCVIPGTSAWQSACDTGTTDTNTNCSMNERDCMGICWGTSENDRCNVCQDPSASEWNSCVGCDNVTNSSYSTNHCGYCMDSSASNFSTYGEDCQDNGSCDDGSYATDACGECLWIRDEDWDACKGCDGVINSNATWHCGLCVIPGTSAWQLACDTDSSGTITDDPIVDKSESATTMSTIALVVGIIAFIILIVAGVVIYKLHRRQKDQSKAFDNILKTYTLMDENPGKGGGVGATSGKRMKKKTKNTCH